MQIEEAKEKYEDLIDKIKPLVEELDKIEAEIDSSIVGDVDTDYEEFFNETSQAVDSIIMGLDVLEELVK